MENLNKKATFFSLMKLLFIILPLLAAILLMGCTSEDAPIDTPNASQLNSTANASQRNSTANSSQVNSSTAGGAYNYPYPPVENSSDGYSAPNNPPLIRERSIISNTSAGDQFPVSFTAEDSEGIRELTWQSSKPFSTGSNGSFNCNSEKVCSITWQLVAIEEGPQQVTITVIDSAGEQNSVSMDIDVRPARMRAVESSVNESNQTTSSISESANASQSGNTSQSNVSDASCNSNSDCGYKERCTSGVCEEVECTTDSQCSGCRRCSYNSCVSCGRGPYGCYC